MSLFNKLFGNKRALYRALFVLSHPRTHSLQEVARIMVKTVPGYASQARESEGKTGMVWISTPIEEYDIQETATKAFGSEINDKLKYEIEIQEYGVDGGMAKSLMVYKK